MPNKVVQHMSYLDPTATRNLAKKAHKQLTAYGLALTVNEVELKIQRSRLTRKTDKPGLIEFNGSEKDLVNRILLSTLKGNVQNEVALFLQLLMPGDPLQINTKSYIKPLELDIYSIDHKIAIEVNEDLWHSSSKDKTLHQKKIERCKAEGITLGFVWETDWIFRRHLVEAEIFKLVKGHNKTLGPLISKIGTKVPIRKDPKPKSKRPSEASLQRSVGLFANIAI